MNLEHLARNILSGQKKIDDANDAKRRAQDAADLDLMMQIKSKIIDERAQDKKNPKKDNKDGDKDQSVKAKFPFKKDDDDEPAEDKEVSNGKSDSNQQLSDKSGNGSPGKDSSGPPKAADTKIKDNKNLRHGTDDTKITLGGVTPVDLDPKIDTNLQKDANKDSGKKKAIKTEERSAHWRADQSSYNLDRKHIDYNHNLFMKRLKKKCECGKNKECQCPSAKSVNEVEAKKAFSAYHSLKGKYKKNTKQSIKSRLEQGKITKEQADKLQDAADRIKEDEEPKTRPFSSRLRKRNVGAGSGNVSSASVPVAISTEQVVQESIEPKVGMKFKHARVLNDKNEPADYIVTKIGQGVVYYKQPGEKKAKEYTPVEKFHHIVHGSGAPKKKLNESIINKLSGGDLTKTQFRWGHEHGSSNKSSEAYEHMPHYMAGYKAGKKNVSIGHAWIDYLKGHNPDHPDIKRAKNDPVLRKKYFKEEIVQEFSKEPWKAEPEKPKKPKYEKETPISKEKINKWMRTQRQFHSGLHAKANNIRYEEKKKKFNITKGSGKVPVVGNTPLADPTALYMGEMNDIERKSHELLGDKEAKKCSHCHGTGKVKSSSVLPRECKVCHGRGSVMEGWLQHGKHEFTATASEKHKEKCPYCKSKLDYSKFESHTDNDGKVTHWKGRCRTPGCNTRLTVFNEEV